MAQNPHIPPNIVVYNDYLPHMNPLPLPQIPRKRLREVPQPTSFHVEQPKPKENHRSKPRAKRSKSHIYFEDHPTDKDKRICKECKKEVTFVNKTTSGMLSHMKRCDRIVELEQEKELEEIRTYTNTQFLGSQVFRGNAAKEADEEVYKKQLIVMQKFKLPSTFFEKKEVVDCFRALHPKFKPRSARTFKVRLDAMPKLEKTRRSRKQG
eukprot:snap_masked-scaffold_6-processed-gene-4.31-mRNA-1 protein AED:1.00 eAED:1.00 QI:0/-1/0/0/-1/1/1/0/208